MTHTPQKQYFTARLWQENEWVVAQCLEIDIASQGKTQQKALNNLREALELHFEPPCVPIGDKKHVRKRYHSEKACGFRYHAE